MKSRMCSRIVSAIIIITSKFILKKSKLFIFDEIEIM